MAKIENILFIDDDIICTFLNVTLVEELGIAKRVESINTAEEALEYMKAHYSGKSAHPAGHPDLIFLDIKMPGMDGFEFLEELDRQKDIDKSRFLIIMLSASLNPGDQCRAVCQSDMVFKSLTKPLFEEDVLKLLDGVLKTK
jgi:CheY-like chemotaxis protein